MVVTSDTATPAPAHSPTRGLVEAGHRRLLRLPRGTDKQPCPAGLPQRRRNPLVVQPPAARPAGPNNVGEDEEDGRRVAPRASHSSPLAISALCRQAPEVGAVCGVR